MLPAGFLSPYGDRRPAREESSSPRMGSQGRRIEDKKQGRQLPPLRSMCECEITASRVPDPALHGPSWEVRTG